MNTYKKYCPNVFLAKCDEEHEKGDRITLTTRYGKENEHIIHNLILERDDCFFYSITRADGFTSQTRAENKANKYNGWAHSAKNRSEDWSEKSNEGKDFLSLGEPIKVGHHSERRHRALLERNNNRMRRSIEEDEKRKAYKNKAEFWDNKATEINLSMPESIEYFKEELEKAKKYHQGLKDGSIPRDHSFSLTYAKKRCNELEKKHQIAERLWG